MLISGWREWVSLPDLNIPKIKAKIDTGARTSALHAFKLEYFIENKIEKIRFSIHPFQYKLKSKTTIECVAKLKDKRFVTDSGGHREARPIIETSLKIGTLIMPIEISLTCRDDMRFKMLLGRTALQHRIMVNPSASYLLGKRKSL